MKVIANIYQHETIAESNTSNALKLLKNVDVTIVWPKFYILEMSLSKNRKMKKILVLCTGNSCRSQIAEGYLRHFANDTSTIYSAGVETHGVNVNAIATMKEDGIDISNHTSNKFDEYYDIDFDYVITVCDNAKERCPFFPIKAKKFHHNFPDPAKFTGTDEEIKDEFRKVRQLIKDYCKEFAVTHL